MTRLLPALHEGHAPIQLHQAFSDALDAFTGWNESTPEPCVDFDAPSVHISSVFGRMRTCTDLLPIRLLEEVEAISNSTLSPSERPALYADAARIMRAICVQRRKA